MNRINPAKLRNSKWTAIEPVNREKHFLVSEVEYDDYGVVISCKLEAVLSKNEYSVDWKDLRHRDKWLQGWK
ncbi:TIGR02450 family Trp-rich protein [Vibrio harveyi]|uniref:TIGR02450 family Trp-rich protein n=1 Tax=Vibrio harveyi TaxID=669 RepID=UPI000576ABA0|nr:TIGR02450 family Trp-rich protein [Vibrio harveyi]MBY7704219.1 TIGR02450 family Trp-rich protein [Vibrio harveyi]PNM54796.1 TIGR02450 family Trp-rich protein [Vibrio harveyi]UIL59023.1 TIGR02450 family Trp-rich protein [Vibrio harveyi]SQA34652.1 Tryptophan-rich protein (DUF2389) [Vibrio harveyi]